MSLESGSNSRFKAVREVISRGTRKFEIPMNDNGQPLKVSEYFGLNTFDARAMRDKLPKDVFLKLQATAETGKKLDLDIANVVAHAVKEWALDRGVTHFCHWFQPQTGSTAEKHDAFLTIDEQRRPMERFSGSQLIQSEPDASSFPSGGMRSTFEARGYTAWDPSSPMFIMESVNGKTLCIPSAFISYHGDALDEKTGMMRSMEVLSERSCELLHLIGDTDAKRVIPTLGCEQEYFLIDRAFYALRPDLILTGRTLLGASPPKGQQLEDHYFGSIPTRVQACMHEMEQELYKLGVPIKTRHNEVAPSQFEAAPIFEEVNVATDHNQLVMEVLRKVAKRHQFEALFHEKPFAGINGSGKHNNWSMQITASGDKLDGVNLLDPGKTPHQNLRFLLFLVATIRGVHKHPGLLRAGIASAANDHRLGANEAPPAIMSVFLGSQLNEIVEKIEKGVQMGKSTEEVVLQLGVSKLPAITKDNTDRNRTSPFAFTGNKFEFRAVGSSANSAFPVTLLNAAVADGLTEIIAALKAKSSGGRVSDQAIWEVLREQIRNAKPICFEGNNYSEEWVKEAEKRGIPNLRKTPEALAQLITAQSKALLTGLKIFSEAELVSRYHVRVENYVKRVLIEVNTLRNMVDTQILPACFAYHATLSEGAAAAKAAGVSAPQAQVLNQMSSLLASLQSRRAAFESAVQKVESIHNEEEKARLLAAEILTGMEGIRTVCDDLEKVVADQYWPLPKYLEILFVS